MKLLKNYWTTAQNLFVKIILSLMNTYREISFSFTFSNGSRGPAITAYLFRRSQNMNSEYDNVTLSELEHEDSTVTILTTFNCTGLQVKLFSLV